MSSGRCRNDVFSLAGAAPSDALAQVVPARDRVGGSIRSIAAAGEQLPGLPIRDAPAQHDPVGGIEPVVGESRTQDAETPTKIRKIVLRILAGAAEESDFRSKRTCRPRGGRETPKQDGERQ